MSTILYQQPSQPSMDSSHVVEATTMRLKVLLPTKSYNQKTLFAAWSLLQSPSSYKTIDDYFKSESTNSYLQHNQKSLKLSQKSLELCTESLGSETGSDTSDIFVFPDSSLSTTERRRDKLESKKVLSRSFPPPLTTISGSNPFQVRPHREGGRLIIEAMETNLGNSVLQAERSHGRLRLTCWKDEEGGFEHENEMKESRKGEEEMERNVLVENVRMLRRCNEDEHGDKGIMCCNWETTCWVATS